VSNRQPRTRTAEIQGFCGDVCGSSDIFVSLLVRFIAAILYVLLSKLYQKKVYELSLAQVKGTKWIPEHYGV
jgi:hypothetical protein